ncbi:MAG: nicotinamide riboside transporter PnuC [Bacteroidia bacterium]|nr:nicotinamide riboside transporter PnuC [Bacteroidia bacterium]
MNWWEIISAVLGLSCVFLAGRGLKANFYVGYIYNVFLFVLFWRQSLYSAMILQPVAFGINAFGHWRWTHPREDEISSVDGKSLKVSRMPVKTWAIVLGLVAVCGAVWGLFLKGTDDPSPWLDSYVLMATFLAQYLSAQKKWECWTVWLVVNVANIILYISAGLYVMPVVSLLYLINGVWSLFTWFRMYKKEL